MDTSAAPQHWLVSASQHPAVAQALLPWRLVTQQWLQAESLNTRRTAQPAVHAWNNMFPRGVKKF